MFSVAVFDDTAMEWAVVSRKHSKNVRKTIQSLDQVVHLWELLRIGMMQKSQVWERLLAKKLLKVSQEDD